MLYLLSLVVVVLLLVIEWLVVRYYAVNEFVEAAIETYKANYPNTPVLPDDIKKLTGEDFLKIAGIKKGELDILDGSPPCSAFSIAGKREKGWDQDQDIFRW